VADVDETPAPGETAEALVVRLARAKASAVATRCTRGCVLGGDTVVVRDGVILGKPADRDEAAEMLRSLAGRRHAVLSGVALVDAASGREVHDLAASQVVMRAIDEPTLQAYLDGDEWRGKAGAYAIQGDAGAFMTLESGALDTVIGLPVQLVRQLLTRLYPSESAS